MGYINLFIKGMIIGIGKIIPGVSGSMLAISLGVYDKIFESISSLLRDFKKNAKFLINIGLGIVVAIILMSKLIIFYLNKNYFLVMMLFIGLIIGGVISVFKKVSEDVSIKNFFLLIIPFLILYFLNLLTNNINLTLNLTLTNSFFLGIIEALTMVIPGISGTAIMMMLGVYEEQLKMFNEIEYFPYLFVFMSGVFICVILFSKIIINFLNSHRISCYYLIIGFSLSSMIILIMTILSVNVKIFELILGIILLLIGVFVSHKLE